MDSQELMSDYLFNLDSYWEGNIRQLNKAKRRLESILDFYQWDIGDALYFLESIYNKRTNENSKTIYISNMGSSGSHLLQHIFLGLQPTIALGELYFSEKILECASKLCIQERRKFIEMYHLSAASDPKMIFSNSTIVNTAHKPNLSFFSEGASTFIKILLTRDPIELVISRTFRKKEYRDHLYPNGIGDMEYLDENIQKVAGFYKTALKNDFNLFIDYKEIVNNRNSLHAKLRTIVGGGLELSCAEDVVRRALDNGKKTNKYAGDRIPVESTFVEYTKEKLRGLQDKISTLTE